VPLQSLPPPRGPDPRQTSERSAGGIGLPPILRCLLGLLAGSLSDLETSLQRIGAGRVGIGSYARRPAMPTWRGRFPLRLPGVRPAARRSALDPDAGVVHQNVEPVAIILWERSDRIEGGRVAGKNCLPTFRAASAGLQVAAAFGVLRPT
jgi:hypothetical protein